MDIIIVPSLRGHCRDSIRPYNSYSPTPGTELTLMDPTECLINLIMIYWAPVWFQCSTFDFISLYFYFLQWGFEAYLWHENVDRVRCVDDTGKALRTVPGTIWHHLVLVIHEGVVCPVATSCFTLFAQRVSLKQDSCVLPSSHSSWALFKSKVELKQQV